MHMYMKGSFSFLQHPNHVFKGIPPGTYIVKVSIFHGYTANFYELFSIQIVDVNMYYNIFLFYIELQIFFLSCEIYESCEFYAFIFISLDYSIKLIV